MPRRYFRPTSASNFSTGKEDELGRGRVTERNYAKILTHGAKEVMGEKWGEDGGRKLS